MIDFATYGMYLAAMLFCLGLAIMIVKRNMIFVLIGVELILNAANLNMVIFSRNDPNLGGQIFTIFSIVIAAAEVTVALAIALNVYKYYKTSDLDEVNELKH
ncbi:MAG: NADH-quinone oxidoreductase subunit NuoK [Cyclobacteriaceae bacterium]|nr:NADH-quinone oxidoreductase subunit NuoK [Cyclobacteriaceae bacterium HetDA_MAG_MS6]